MIPTPTRIGEISTEIVIVGSGPAGLTAGLYASRAGRKTLVLEGRAASRLSIGYTIENYPGFVAIDSLELLGKFRAHAEHFGAEILRADATDFSLAGSTKLITTRDALIQAPAVIIATGRAIPREKLIPGEERFLGMGVSYCATCDGPLFRGQKVLAVGNTEEAGEDVLALDEMGCEVHWIPGEADLHVPQDVVDAIREKGIPILPHTRVEEILGAQRVEAVLLEKSGQRDKFRASAVFIFRDAPTAPIFERAGLELDHRQCIKVDRFQRTNLDGVFAAGDVTCGGLQVVAAAGEGCVAALQALHYLRSEGKTSG